MVLMRSMSMVLLSAMMGRSRVPAPLAGAGWATSPALGGARLVASNRRFSLKRRGTAARTVPGRVCANGRTPGRPAESGAMTPLPATDEQRARRRHWRVLRVWTVLLLLAWGVVTFGVAYEARALSFDFFGWPFSFWVGAQGALLVYVGLVSLYARVARQLDESADLDEQD
jgi:putative solute:sodium symporter small subunit